MFYVFFPYWDSIFPVGYCCMLFRFNISFCINNGLGKNIYILLILSAYALHTCSGYVLLIQVNKMHERMNVWITTFWGFCIDTKYLRLLYHLQNKRLICYLKSSHRSTIDNSFTIFADTLLRILNGSITLQLGQVKFKFVRS